MAIYVHEHVKYGNRDEIIKKYYWKQICEQKIKKGDLLGILIRWFSAQFFSQ